MTRQRQLVYSIVAEKPIHMTAEEIYLKAREQMPSLARGTVYRNLGILAEEGMIRKLEMPDAPARYDRQHVPHPHLVCETCGCVEDLVMPEGMLKPLTRMVNVPLTGFDLKLFYVCPDCEALLENLD